MGWLRQPQYGRGGGCVCVYLVYLHPTKYYYSSSFVKSKSKSTHSSSGGNAPPVPSHSRATHSCRNFVPSRQHVDTSVTRVSSAGRSSGTARRRWPRYMTLVAVARLYGRPAALVLEPPPPGVGGFCHTSETDTARTSREICCAGCLIVKCDGVPVCG